MNKKRLIINSIIAIILVSMLFISNTYSIFTSGDVEEDINVYTTGNLNITYTLSSDVISLNNKTPINEKNNYFIKPYRITVHNNGTVPYQFNLILKDTTASDVISYKYIKARVGRLNSVSLGSVRDNIIKGDIIVGAGEQVDIDVRVWLDSSVSNEEIGKSFYAKLFIDGIAIYSDNGGYDNSNLVYPMSYNIFSDYIAKLYDDGEKTEVVLDDKVKVNVNTNKGIMLDNNGEYRYYGVNPNNYVLFNDELWRIVSVSDTYYDNHDLKAIKRVKIVSDKVNVELKDKSKELIDTSLYYKGETNVEEVFDMYKAERLVRGDTLLMGNIYLTDYIYTKDYDNNSWLDKENGFVTMTFKEDMNYFVSGDKEISLNNLGDVYPSLYLKPDVCISGGDGSKNNPYKIVNAIDMSE